MPPLALISSAASCAAGPIDEPATACASEMTPILIGSAAKAVPARAKVPQASEMAVSFMKSPGSFRSQMPGVAGILASRLASAQP